MKCACGCGVTVTPGKMYRHGHWLRDHTISKRVPKPASAETRAKMSAAHKGKTRSPEHTAKIAMAKTGHKYGPMSEEHKAKLRKPKTKKKGPLSEAHKAKLSAATKGIKTGPKTPEHIAKIVKSYKKNPEWWRKQREHLAKVRPQYGPSKLEDFVATQLYNLKILHKRQAKLGWYRVDFLLPKLSVVIEVDGTYWHGRLQQQADDARRDAWLTRHGYTVLRLKEADIDSGGRDFVVQSLQHFI